MYVLCILVVYNIYIYTHITSKVCTDIYIYIYVFMCTYIHTLSHMCTYKYMFIYTYTYAPENVCVINNQFPKHSSYIFTERILSYASHHLLTL